MMGENRPRWMYALVVGSLLGALAGVAEAEPGLSATEIKIGQCAAMSGPAQGLGTEMNLGLRAALEESNAAGGVNGRKLTLLAVDDGYEPERAVDRTVQLIEQDKVFALAGYVGTPTSKVVVPILADTKVPLIGIFSGAMLLRQPVQRYVINLRASYDDETETLIDHLTRVGKASRIAIFYQNDSFGLAGLSGTEKALTKRGLALVGKGTFERNTLAIKTGLAAILDSKPDAVIIIAPYKPAAAFTRELKSSGAKAVVATISFVGTANLISELGAGAEGIIISQVVPSPEDTTLPLVRRYTAALKHSAPDAKPSFVSLEGYLGGKLLITALTRAGKEVTREKLVDAIEAMASFDLGGLTLGFTPTNHQGSRTVFLTQVANQTAKPIVR